MMADYLSKPTQGAVFRKQRDITMGDALLIMEDHVEINGNSIDEECNAAVKNRPGINRKRRKEVQCGYLTFMKRGHKEYGRRSNRHHSLDQA